ncbi:MAG: ABC transporter substrate-binding protein [Spirochaetes bacterium]|nr:ABC transporter substrate-binding protein [Spirochaetota bacterium]
MTLSLVAVISIGCSKKQAAEGDVLKIGVTSMLGFPTGIEIENWFRLYAKMVNDEGGWKIGDKVYKLDLLTEDHGGDPSKHRSALEKLIFQEEVKIILESMGAWPTTSAQVAEQNKVLIIGQGFGDESATPKFNYFFRGQGLFFLRGSNYVMYNEWKKNGAKNVLLVNPDSEGGKANTEQFSKVLPVVGLEALPPVFFPADVTDFSGVAIKAKQLNADCIDMGAALDDQVVNFLKALKEVGWKGQLYPGMINANLLANLNKTVGKEFIEGSLVPYTLAEGMTSGDKEVARYFDAYKTEYDGKIGEDGAFWTAPWFIFKGAVEATQSTDHEVLKKYLENKPRAEKTLLGWVQLFARPDLGNNRTIDSMVGHGIGIIKNGKVEFFKKVAIKDQYLATVLCNNMVDTYQKYWDKFGKPEFPKGDEKISVLDYKDLK